jgi:hypothetical protein
MKRYAIATGLLLAASVLAADAPTTAPSPAPAGEKRTLLNGQVEYTSPAGWTFSEKNATEELVAFVSPDRASGLLMMVQPQGMHPDVGIARAIIKQLREDHKKRGDTKMIQEPKIEPSKDFEVRISEEDESKGSTYAKLYLYRLRGKRTISLTITAINSADADAKRATLKVGEDLLLSAKWLKKK